MKFSRNIVCWIHSGFILILDLIALQILIIQF